MATTTTTTTTMIAQHFFCKYINISLYVLLEYIPFPIKPIYNIGEKSGIRIWKVMPTISMILLRGFFDRMIQKYIIRDTHPLILFYFVGLLTFWPGIAFGLYLFAHRILVGPVEATSALFAMFMTMFGLNFLMFALWFDMDDNRRLR